MINKLQIDETLSLITYAFVSHHLLLLRFEKNNNLKSKKWV